jgi:hypothetical protein
MARDLDADLAAAQEDGVSAAEYVGHDPRSFALAWAQERGVIEGRVRLALTVAAALIGAVPGVGLGLFVAYGLTSYTMTEIIGPGRTVTGVQRTLDLPPLVLLALYAVGGVFAYAGAIAAVAGLLHWTDDPAASLTVRLLGMLLPFGAIASIATTIAFASTRSFSTDHRTVLADVIIASVVFACAVAAIRFRAVRQQRHAGGHAQPPLGAW